MGASRYGTSGNAALGGAPALNPNTQTTTGSSSTVQNSGQSSFQGLTGQNAASLTSVINQLMYGTTTPAQAQTQYQLNGKVVGESEMLAAGYKKAPDGSMVFYNSKPGGGYDAVTVQPLADKTPGQAATFEGTPAMKEQQAARLKLISDLQTSLASYSPDAAKKDSLEALKYTLQLAMEKNMPAISRSIENAGTSGGSQEALLSQDLATRSAGEAALLQTQTVQGYGQIGASLSNTLANLATSEDPVMKALLGALNLGQVSSSAQSSSSTQTSTDNTAPLGVTNPELFTPPASASASTPTPAAPTQALAQSGGQAGTGYQTPQGSGYISSSNGTTLFGNTSLADVKKALGLSEGV